MLLRNPVSLAGIALALVSLANIFLFVVIDLIATKPNSTPSRAPFPLPFTTCARRRILASSAIGPKSSMAAR